jgi:hypothetical protein
MTNPIQRMHEAQRLIDDPLFNEALNAVETEIFRKLKGPSDGKEAEWLLALRLMGKVRAWVIGVIQTGKVELDEDQRKKKAKA